MITKFEFLSDGHLNHVGVAQIHSELTSNEPRTLQYATHKAGTKAREIEKTDTDRILETDTIETAKTK